METTTQEDIPKKAVRALKVRLQVVKKHLEPILSKPLTEINAKLPPAERYELQVLLSYSLNTLFYIYMRTQGADPQKHEVMTELVRVQQYIKKLKKVQGNEEKPSLKVDKAAAARFIKAAISENKEEDNSSNKKRKVEEDADSSSSEEEEGESKDGRKMNVFSKNSSKKKVKK